MIMYLEIARQSQGVSMAAVRYLTHHTSTLMVAVQSP